LSVLSAFVIFPSHIYDLLTILGVCIVIGGVIWPLCTTIISNLAPEQMQGKILSISQSIQSLALATSPLIAGFAFKSSPELPFLIGSGAFLLAGIIFWIQNLHTSSKTG
jgi:predicted MFS family arabinose efflux permease